MKRTLLCRFRLWISVQFHSVASFLSNRGVTVRGGLRKKEGRDRERMARGKRTKRGRGRIDIIILVVRRRLSRSSYKCIGVPSGSVGSHEVMNLTVWDIYPLEFGAILHSCLSMVGQALNFPLLSHSLSLTKSVVKLTAVSVCQSESESYKSTHLSRRKLWFHLSLSREFLPESGSAALHFVRSSFFV